MSHVVLLGDSIFDNARYVPEKPPVIEQVRRTIPANWKATLLAVDGHITGDVVGQLENMPSDATHLCISVGGNDALGASGLLREAACTVADALALLSEGLTQFRDEYHAMLRAISAAGKPTTICTIYDAVPGLEKMEVMALGFFNDVILRSAFMAGLPVIDLRLVCNHSSDYSAVSPIEPSFTGGAKIAQAIKEALTSHDFSQRRSVIYS